VEKNIFDIRSIWREATQIHFSNFRYPTFASHIIQGDEYNKLWPAAKCLFGGIYQLMDSSASLRDEIDFLFIMISTTFG